jgi:alkylation response protein AidB-like acyl-CoA dehydrogenase
MDFQLSDFHKDLVAVAGRLARDHFPEGAAIDRRGVERDTLPREFLQVLASHGFAGMSMPEDIGGQGGKLLDAVLVIEAMAHASPIAGDCVQALNFGAIQQLANLGSASIVERYLTPCLNGEKVVTIAMSEPDAGSAVTDLRSRARVVDDTVIVNGQKLFTTNSEYADCFVVWVNFGDSSRTAGAVLVERDTPGFTIDSSHHFMSGDRYGMLYLDEAGSRSTTSLSRKTVSARCWPCSTLSGWAIRPVRWPSVRPPSTWQSTTPESAGSLAGDWPSSRVCSGASPR